jgi:hypothetical protein
VSVPLRAQHRQQGADHRACQKGLGTRSSTLPLTPACHIEAMVLPNTRRQKYQGDTNAAIVNATPAIPNVPRLAARQSLSAAQLAPQLAAHERQLVGG